MVIMIKPKAGLRAPVHILGRLQKIRGRLHRHAYAEPSYSAIDAVTRSGREGPTRHTSFHIFMNLRFEDLSGNELLLLSRRLESEHEVRLATRRPSTGFMPADAIAHCISALANEELDLAWQRITREYDRRDSLAHDQTVIDQEAEPQPEDLALTPEEDHLKEMGHVSLSNVSMIGLQPVA